MSPQSGFPTSRIFWCLAIPKASIPLMDRSNHYPGPHSTRSMAAHRDIIENHAIFVARYSSETRAKHRALACVRMKTWFQGCVVSRSTAVRTRTSSRGHDHTWPPWPLIDFDAFNFEKSINHQKAETASKHRVLYDSSFAIFSVTKDMDTS